MAYSENTVTHIHLNNENTDINHPIAHTAKNESGNIELQADGCKLNLTSTSEIQIKPGNGEGVQFDNEQQEEDKNKSEISIKTANGSFDKNTKGRVIGLKINTAELTFDTQKAHNAPETATSEEDTFDREEFIIKFRQDKWNEGVHTSEKGPVYAKLKAQSFDIRCHDHGGIALQIAGKDSDNNENKIKFESDRTNAITQSTGVYNGEGGKGLEFGTFNNKHSSLFTNDYRFNKDGEVFAVTRGELTTVDGKTDYPTQSDDFKDIIDDDLKTTWEDIVIASKLISIMKEKSGSYVDKFEAACTELFGPVN